MEKVLFTVIGVGCIGTAGYILPAPVIATVFGMALFGVGLTCLGAALGG